MKILDADPYTVHWWINDGIIGRMVDNDGVMVYTKLIHFSLWSYGYNWWINDASAYDMETRRWILSASWMDPTQVQRLMALGFSVLLPSSN